MSDIKKTCLHDRHMAMGAMMSPFAGWDMPIQYSGITEEHNAVREAAGLFDVSHMGEFLVEGPDAVKFVDRVFTNEVAPMAPGQVAYGMFTRHDGGVVDDLLVYKRGPESVLLVVNAANIDKDFAWLEEQVKADGNYNVTLTNISDEVSELALQGPDAEEIVRKVMGIDLKDLEFYHFRELEIDGHKALISRTGYTGEDGFEIYGPAAMIISLWDRLIEGGAAPCGLGCRDTLRFEVGLPLYGHELADDISPVEGSLSMFAKFEKPGGFIGSDVIARQKAEGARKRIVGLEIDGRVPARQGTEVLDLEGNVVGHVTTGYQGISAPGSFAMALVDAAHAKRDTKLLVQVRRKRFGATIIPRRFYKKSYKK